MPIPISISSSPISKVGNTGLRNDAGSECGSHRAAGVGGLLSQPGDFGQVGAGVGGGSGDLEGVDHPGDAAATLRLLRSGTGDIVSKQDRGSFDVLELQHLGGHVEVHDIASVVAVHAEYARTAVRGAHGVCDLIDRR